MTWRGFRLQSQSVSVAELRASAQNGCLFPTLPCSKAHPAELISFKPLRILLHRRRFEEHRLHASTTLLRWRIAPAMLFPRRVRDPPSPLCDSSDTPDPPDSDPGRRGVPPDKDPTPTPPLAKAFGAAPQVRRARFSPRPTQSVILKRNKSFFLLPKCPK